MTRGLLGETTGALLRTVPALVRRARPGRANRTIQNPKADAMRHRHEGPVSGVLAKSALLVAAVATIAFPPPILDDLGIVAFVVLALIIVTGRIGRNRRAGTLTLTAIALVLLGQILPGIEIDEGHNYLLFTGAESEYLAEALPPPVLRFARERFEETYPTTNTTCRARAGGSCWRDYATYDKPYAFSADAVWQDPLWSRTVQGFDFDSATRLRSGFLNDHRSNWYEWLSSGDPVREHAPYFVRFRIPPEAAGSSLCIAGTHATKPAGRPWTIRRTGDMDCTVLGAASLPLDIIGLQFGAEEPLRARFEPAFRIDASNWLRLALGVTGAILLVAAWIRPRWAVCLPVAAFALLAHITIEAQLHLRGHESLFSAHQFLLHEGGGDQLTHWKYGRRIVEAAREGDWSEALRGGVNVFYFMPGLRYVNALQATVFGESNFASWVGILLVPGLVYLLLRGLIPAAPAAASTVLFSLLVMRYYADHVDHLAESVGYPMALGGVLLGVAALRNREYSAWTLLLAAGLLATSVIPRPNLLPACGLFVLMLWASHLRAHGRSATIALCAGFSISLLPLLHNLHFGGQFILLTRASAIPENLLNPPHVWWGAFVELVHGDLHGPNLSRWAVHMHRFVTGFAGMVFLLTLCLVLIGTPVLYLNGRLAGAFNRLRSAMDRPLAALMVFWAGLACVLLFYHPRGRYALLAGICSWIVVTVVGWRVFRPAAGDRSPSRPDEAVPDQPVQPVR